jgi:serine/threonine protein phosphatase PrpC
MTRVQKRNNDEDIRTQVSTYQTIGKRINQEDRYLTTHIQGGHLVAIFDGHGGENASESLAAYLPVAFWKEYNKVWLSVINRSKITPKVERQIIRRTIASLRKKLQNEVSGSTLSMVYVRPIGRGEDGVRRLWVTAATIGDSPLMIWNGKRYLLMPMHCAAHHQADRKRIIESRMGRLQGDYFISRDYRVPGIAVTRAIGDSEFGDTLIRRADIRSFEVDSRAVIVIASDGVLVSAEPSDAKETMRKIVKMARDGSNAAELGKHVGKTHDNVTIAVVTFSEDE